MCLHLILYVLNRSEHLVHGVLQIGGGTLMEFRLNIIFLGFRFLYSKLRLWPIVVAIQVYNIVHLQNVRYPKMIPETGTVRH